MERSGDTWLTRGLIFRTGPVPHEDLGLAAHFYRRSYMPRRMFFLSVSGGDWIELIGDYRTVAEAQIVAERQAGGPCQFGGSLVLKGAPSPLPPMAVNPDRPRRRRRPRGSQHL